MMVCPASSHRSTRWVNWVRVLRRAESNCSHASPAGQDRCRGGSPTARHLCRLTSAVVQNGEQESRLLPLGRPPSPASLVLARRSSIFWVKGGKGVEPVW